MPPARGCPPAASPVWPRLAAAGFAAFACATLALHLLRPELAAASSQMSLYLVGPWAFLLQAGYLALGLGMLALAVGIDRSLAAAARSAAPALVMALASLCLAITAFAQTDLPGGERSLQGLVHGLSAQGAFLFATTGLVLLAMRLRLDPRWRTPARWLLPWALACFAAIWVLALWRSAPRGLAQKAVIGLILGWLATACALLWQRCRAALHPASPP